VAALTATAAPPVREEIVSRLRMRDPVEVVRGFDRPNLFLEVLSFTEDEQKRAALVERVAGEPKPGIVYAATRKETGSLAAELRGLGLSAAAYHAGLRGAERTRVQEQFMTGGLDVAVATVAFGMGIDKADVRFVIHADVADSMDSYYQEIGRAGRDGEPALGCLFYRPQDLGLRRFFASGAPDDIQLRRVATLLSLAGTRVPARELAAEARVRDSTLTQLVDLLSRAGALKMYDSGEVEALPGAPAPAEAASAALAIAEARRRVEQSRVEMMRGYAETQGCRRQYLLAYFGETLPEPCGNCDTCRAASTGRASRSAGSAAAGSGRPGHQGGPGGQGGARPGEGAGSAEPAGMAAFPVNSAVRHAQWGEGVVMRVEGDRIVVLFVDVGYKTLSLAAVRDRDLLTPA
jgi:ATP-dependent DNA helicase RecQ